MDVSSAISQEFLDYHGGCKPSVVEPPLFWAAPAPDGQVPGVDFGSDLIESAPASGKKKAAPGGSGSIH